MIIMRKSNLFIRFFISSFFIMLFIVATCEDYEANRPITLGNTLGVEMV